MLLPLFFISALFNVAESQNVKNGGSEEERGTIDYKISELMADRVGVKPRSSVATLEDINKKMMADMLKEESLLFPAYDLYGGLWENTHVNAYRNKSEINVPDTFEIDCSSYVSPVGENIRITSKFGHRRRRMHYGVDLKVQTGDTIYAAFEGKVRVRRYERRGYGYFLVLRHPNGLETVYGHLSKFLVERDDVVRAGMPIALGGNTGRSTGSHLHFETRFLGQPLNPQQIIDFPNCTPINDLYTFVKKKDLRYKGSNRYTSVDGSQVVYYRIRKGDTLGHIARRYGTTVSKLCSLNGLTPKSILRINQKIRCN